MAVQEVAPGYVLPKPLVQVQVYFKGLGINTVPTEVVWFVCWVPTLSGHGTQPALGDEMK